MNKPVAMIIGVAVALSVVACSGDPSSTPGSGFTITSSSPAGVESTSPPAAEIPGAGETPITITAGDETITAVLNDSQVSRDFAAMLPVTLPWFRNSEIEYITEMSAPLTETGPFYTDVQPGDLVYYNPLDSITIIYSETSSVPTLTKMGEITSDLSVFEGLPDEIDMRVTLSE